MCAMPCCFRGGFTDKNGNKYNPNMVRLGSEEALSSAAAEVGGTSNMLLYVQQQRCLQQLQAMHCAERRCDNKAHLADVHI